MSDPTEVLLIAALMIGSGVAGCAGGFLIARFRYEGNLEVADNQHALYAARTTRACHQMTLAAQAIQRASQCFVEDGK